MRQIIQINKEYYLLFFIVFFIALEGVFFTIANNKLNNDFRNNEIRLAKVESLLKNTSIKAKAYSIYDITDSQIIYSKNGDIQMPLASLSKIMTIAIALNNFQVNQEIFISKKAIEQAGDFGMYSNEKWNINDLAKFTLISSANDGAYAMSEGDDNYLEKMNSKAKRIGMEKALFLNSTGLDFDEKRASTFASAEDVNVMTRYALNAYPNIFNVTTLSEISLKSNSGFIHNAKNTNIVLDKIPNILFSKTGYTEIAGGNLTIIFKDTMEHKIAITILGSTFYDRFIDIERLVNVLELSYTK